MRLKNIFNEATASEVIKDLDKVKNDLLKKVDVLVAKKKKLYSNVDIESPMSADEKKLDKEIADLFSDINQLVLQKRSLKKESVNEGLYFVGYNKGRGQGTGVFKDSYSSYKDAKKAVEKIEKERGGSYNQIAYYVADKDGKFVRESINEEDNKSPEEILRGLKEMAMGDLERIEDYAEMISDRMKEGQELSSWMYSQITLAVDQLNSVHDAMDGKDGVKESVNENLDNYSKDAITDMIINLSRYEGNEKLIADLKKILKQRSLGKLKKEQSVNEGREVKAIQSDFNKTVAAIETELLHYKKTKGTPQEKKHVDNLKKLHPIKKKLEAELESAVSGLYRDAELKIED